MNQTITFKKKFLNLLIKTLIDISYHCGHIFKNLADGQTETWIYVQYEFLFFFTHLTMLNASSILGKEKKENFKEVLYPLLKNKTTKDWLAGMAEEIRTEITNNFLDRIKLAEKNYSDCTDIFPDESESPDECLFTRLIKNVIRHGYKNNPLAKMACTEIAYSNNLLNHLHLDGIY